jgi:hypothetical protein
MSKINAQNEFRNVKNFSWSSNVPFSPQRRTFMENKNNISSIQKQEFIWKSPTFDKIV